MKSTNYSNGIITKNEIFFMLEDFMESTLYNGSLDIEEIEFLDSLEISKFTIQQLEEQLIPKAVRSKEVVKGAWSLNELLAMFIKKTYSDNLPLKSNCFVFYVKDNKLKYVGDAKIAHIEEGIDTSLNMINDFIYN